MIRRQIDGSSEVAIIISKEDDGFRLNYQGTIYHFEIDHKTWKVYQTFCGLRLISADKEFWRFINQDQRPSNN